jgi:hypothetical protein
MTPRLGSLAALVLALALAVVLALLARAAFAVQRDLGAPGAPVRTVVPGDRDGPVGRALAERILSPRPSVMPDPGDDALAEAIARFRSSHSPHLPPTPSDLGRTRAREAALRLLEGEARFSLRSRAANLLGILSFEDALLAPDDADPHLRESLAAFESAARLDPANADAKFNLELLLRLLARANGSAAANVPFAQGSSAAQGTAAVAGGTGGGY